MDIKRISLILLGVMILSLGVGFYSLRYIDNFRFSDYLNENSIEITDDDDYVKIGGEGIQVLDGDTSVTITWRGIEVIEDGKLTIIGLNGINLGLNLGGKLNLKEQSLDTQIDAEIASDGLIKINSSFANISVYQVAGDKVSAILKGNYKGSERLELKLTEIPGGIEIKAIPEGNSFTIVNSNLNLMIGIPDGFSGKIEASSSSANVNIKGLILDEVNVETSSGSVKLDDVTSTSGQVVTSSGNQEILPLFGDYRLQSSSGNIVLKLTGQSGNVQAQASSGGIEVDMEKDLAYTIDAETSSGNIDYSGSGNVTRRDKDVMEIVIGDGSKSLDLSTSSGNISIDEN